MKNTYNLHDSVVLLKTTELSEDKEFEFYVQSGARLLFSLVVDQVSGGSSVDVIISNAFSADVTEEEVLTLSSNFVGHTNKVLIDCHKNFRVRIVPTGTITCALGLAIHDNAIVSSSRVENQSLDVKIVDSVDPNNLTKKTQVSENLIHNRNFGKHPKGTKVEQQFSEEGFTNGRGDYNATTNEKPNSGGLIAHIRNVSLTLVHQVMRVTAIKSGDVTALDVAIRDESGNPYTGNNPFPVTLAESEDDEILEALISPTPVDKNEEDIHEYIVPVGKIFLLEQVLCSSSGQSRFIIEAGAVGSEDFITARYGTAENLNPDVSFVRAKKLTAGHKVKITRTNKDSHPMDLVSTIIGLLKNV